MDWDLADFIAYSLRHTLALLDEFLESWSQWIRIESDHRTRQTIHLSGWFLICVDKVLKCHCARKPLGHCDGSRDSEVLDFGGS